jgi:hypothetical protein
MGAAPGVVVAGVARKEGATHLGIISFDVDSA